jgi:hypothetical protein
LAWYLARQILVFLPELRSLVIPMLPHELERRTEADVSVGLTDEQVWLVRDAFSLTQTLTPTLSDRDRQALDAIVSDLLRAHHLDKESRDEFASLGLLADQQRETDYEVSFFFAGNDGWTDIYTGPRLDVVDALLSLELHPILLAHGVRHILVPPAVNRPMYELPPVQFSVEESYALGPSYKIWAHLPGEDAYLVGHADLDIWSQRSETPTWEVWTYVGYGFALWGGVMWRDEAWHTSLLHNWGIAKPFPGDQLAQAIVHVFAQEYLYLSHVFRLHPTLQEKK